jgi:uncharacterized protein
MKKLLLMIAILFSLNTFGQKFYFPKAYHADSVALSKNIPALAKQVLSVYKEPDLSTYYDNVFRYQLVAEQYEEVNKNIVHIQDLSKQADSIRAKVIGIQFLVYATTKIRQKANATSFRDEYPKVFTQLFNALPKDATVMVSNYFDATFKKYKDNFSKILSSQANQDSISLADARALCRAYNSYHVLAQSVPLALPLMKEQEQKQFIIADSVLIKTRDGATLTAVIVRNRELTEKLPTIFMYTIYNGPVDKAKSKEFALKGYVGIAVNTRGKHLSPQEIEPFEHDAEDVYDVIDWISKQPWSNGKVGMIGGSYLGFTQWAAAKKVHPALKTIIPQVSVGIGVDYPMQNNVFMNYMLRWIHYVTNSKETDRAEFENVSYWTNLDKKWYIEGKSFRSLDSMEGRPSKIFQRWLMHPSFDAYWQNMVACKDDFSKINIPILTTTGYYDADQLGAMYYFNEHNLRNKNANHYLLIGPYNHPGAQGTPTSTLAGYKIDSVANISINNLAYQWFDYTLKGSKKPDILNDKINYQVMGANEWKHKPTLSQMNNDTLNLYLSNVRTGKHYMLNTQLSKNITFINQEIDFKDRSDSALIVPEEIIKNSLDFSNGLTFTTKPFEKSIEINGAFVGELVLSINKKDVDVSVEMYEQTPDGKFFTLGSYLTRASYTKNRSKRQLLQPDKIEKVAINNAFFMSKKISAGSKLILIVDVNKNPNWQLNYGTGKDVSDETIEDAKVPLQVKWYNNSVIKVPVMR